MSRERRTRYFAGTDGFKVYFRASPTRAYLTLSTWRRGNINWWSFHMHDHGMFPVHEITSQDYHNLIGLKQASPHAGTAPSDSWVYITEIPPDMFPDDFAVLISTYLHSVA